MCYTDYTIRVEGKHIKSALYDKLSEGKPLVRSDIAGVVGEEQIALLQHLMKLNFASWMLKPPLVWSLASPGLSSSTKLRPISRRSRFGRVR